MHTHLGAAAQWPRTLSPRARAHFPLITTIRSGRSVRPSAPQSSFRCGRKEGRKEGWKERRGSEMLTGRWGRLLPGERGNDLCRCCILHSSRGARAIFSLCAMADNRDCAHARARSSGLIRHSDSFCRVTRDAHWLHGRRAHAHTALHSLDAMRRSPFSLIASEWLRVQNESANTQPCELQVSKPSTTGDSFYPCSAHFHLKRDEYQNLGKRFVGFYIKNRK